MFKTYYIKEVQHWTKDLIQTTEIEEKMLLQKLKLNWSKLGDGNAAYFHATIRGKNKKAGIYKLEDPIGTILTEHKEIEKEIIRF
ncbi:unnamed protein product [Lathyrus oleraceus]